MATASRQEILQAVLELFRECGYEGTSMAMISERTKLGKASLYHHFPGGKEQMRDELVKLLADWFRPRLEQLKDDATPPRGRVKVFMSELDSFFEGGQRGCLFAALAVGPAENGCRIELKDLMNLWISALAELAEKSGVPANDAQTRAEDCVAQLEGALLVSRIVGDKSIFKRALRQAPDMLFGSSRQLES